MQLSPRESVWGPRGESCYCSTPPIELSQNHKKIFKAIRVCGFLGLGLKYFESKSQIGCVTLCDFTIKGLFQLLWVSNIWGLDLVKSFKSESWFGHSSSRQPQSPELQLLLNVIFKVSFINSIIYGTKFFILHEIVRPHTRTVAAPENLFHDPAQRAPCYG